MSLSSRNYEVVVWGATGALEKALLSIKAYLQISNASRPAGFVGKLVCEYLIKDYRGKVKWAMAARNQQKLATVRQELCKLHPSAQEIPLLTGDLSDRQSLKAIAAQTRVVLNTAGPYTKLGTPVVEACISEKTHHCDLTGEYTWVKQIQRQYQDEAANNGVKIVNCCGFDSIPSDLGAQMLVNHIKEKFGRPTKSITGLVGAISGGASGGTIGSLLLLLEQSPEEMKKAADPYYLNPPGSSRGPDKPDSVVPHWDARAGRYAAPWVMGPTNARIVRKSNAMLGDKYGDGGFSYNEYLGIPYGIVAWGLTAVFGLALATLQISWVRRQIQARLPEGVNRDMMENGKWSVDMYAESDEGRGKPSQIVHGYLKGIQDPGYLDTAKMITESAICLAQQGEECERAGYRRGGILTPASAMGMVLMRRLQHKGFTFTILDDLEPRG